MTKGSEEGVSRESLVARGLLASEEGRNRRARSDARRKQLPSGICEIG